jgi:hypothetical protein
MIIVVVLLRGMLIMNLFALIIIAATPAAEE